MSGGGDGELASELRGEEGTLEGGEERGLEASELASAAIVVSREAAGRRRSGVAAAERSGGGGGPAVDQRDNGII